MMAEALALAARATGLTAPNPAVGCVIVKGERIVGRGATAPGGRPHAEAEALADAGRHARDATAFVTLEPCAHESPRGPPCASELVAAGVDRVVAAMEDPDPRTAGQGFAALRSAGITVEVGDGADQAGALMAGWLFRLTHGRPRVTLKLAMSIDGRIALASGEARWLTSPQAREEAHLLRARSDLIVIGRGTLDADDPELTVRLPGHEHRRPAVAILSRTLDAVPSNRKLARRDPAPALLRSPVELDGLALNDVLVEGGAGTAAAFLAADRVDRRVVHRAPMLLGADAHPGVGALALAHLADAHGRWRLAEARAHGPDLVEVWDALQPAPPRPHAQ
jgi:diaminohydroxyphosphoribosylaminopyrimidine deaminase/5-amino-6-(5-phosphoribosylamino)uracil reductase